jgi:hypothetical protein
MKNTCKVDIKNMGKIMDDKLWFQFIAYCLNHVYYHVPQWALWIVSISSNNEICARSEHFHDNNNEIFPTCS